MFKIPIIKVKDRGEYGHSHIVGTDPHDSLYIDKLTGGIHYHNIQCCASTQKVFDDGEDPDYGFVFEAPEGHFHEAEIEFISPEQLFELIIDTIQVQADKRVKLMEFHQKYLETEEAQVQKIEKAEKKFNIKQLW